MENKETKTKEQKKRSGILGFFSALGPGLVTGAADDDPSGIVTYSQSGATLGLAQLWTMLFLLPLMVAVQEMSARIGLVTGKGISKILKEHYSKGVLYFCVGLLVVANTINLGADIGAMAAVVKLFFAVPFTIFALFFFVITVSLEIFVPYHKYARILKWLTVSLLAYFITGFIVAHDWTTILKATFLPQFQFNFNYLLLLLGVIGTTISPYMFFWQASQEIEQLEDTVLTTHRMTHITKRYLKNMRVDTIFGMFFSNTAAWFIIITTALVLHAGGITNITTAAQAAQALEPLVHGFKHAGKIAEILFSIGVIGTGLLAIPIFAASSSYAISEIFNFKEGLANKLNQAKGFYTIIIVGTFIGLTINFLNINPITALVYTAVINGVVAAPLIFMIIRITNNKKIMGQHTSGFWSNLFAWIAFGGITVAAFVGLYQLLGGML